MSKKPVTNPKLGQVVSVEGRDGVIVGFDTGPQSMILGRKYDPEIYGASENIAVYFPDKPEFRWMPLGFLQKSHKVAKVAFGALKIVGIE